MGCAAVAAAVTLLAPNTTSASYLLGHDPEQADPAPRTPIGAAASTTATTSVTQRLGVCLSLYQLTV